MTIDEAIEFADACRLGKNEYNKYGGWRLACELLADEVRRLRNGEFICKQCGLRKDSEHEQGDF